MENNNSHKSRGVKTILHVLDILEILEEFPKGLRLSEITERIQLPKSTVHRILGVLLDRQYIRESHTDNEYLLGYQILSLSNACLNGIDLLREARPFLKEINKEFNETVILGCLDSNKLRIIYLDKINSSHSLRMVSHVGERAPVHCTALGKAILSKFTINELQEKLKNYDLRKFTEKTITDLKILIQNLQEINEAGYCIDREEYKLHVSCVAAHICNYQGKPIGAISVSIPTTRFSEDKQHQMTKKIIGATQAISEIFALSKNLDTW